jgi:hypothetical protein
MKFNWGWALVIAIALFAIFIGQFFVRGFSHRADLVADDYYNQEVNYQQRINAKARAKALGALVFSPADGQLAISLPQGINGRNATGHIHFYKPNNSSLDMHYTLATDSLNRQLIDVSALPRGLWQVKVEVQYQGESYFWEESINL